MSEKELFDRMEKELFTAVICDALDGLGYRNQTLQLQLYPLKEGQVLAGRAKTVLAVDVSQIRGNAYEHEIKAVDTIVENEVVVVCTNGSVKSGIWGELLSTASIERGARGAIIDGMTRDTRMIKEINFPVFTKGVNPLDSNGRTYVIDYDCTLTTGGVLIAPNDVIFADDDGIVVIPKALLDQTLERAFAKVNGEKRARNDLKAGLLLQDVFDKYGIL